jgi:heptosyltransferase-2
VSNVCSLVVQTSFLGDTVLTTPLLATLAERGPVDVVVRPDAAALLTGHPAVRDLLVYDKRGRDRGLGGLRRLAQAIRWRADGSARGTTVAYLAQQSWRSALLVRLAGVPVRVGWTTAPSRRLYTHAVAYDASLQHAARCGALAWYAEHGPSSAVPRPSLFPAANDIEAARALIGSTDTRPLVVLAPSSVWGTKRWPYYPELAQALAADYRIAVIGSAADRVLSAAIVAAAPDSLDATGRLSLLGTAALLQQAQALVTNDSVPLHLASAMNTPTVALFGPTVPAFGFGPLATFASVVEHDALACRPCHAHGPAVCPLGHFRCMRELPVTRVVQAIHALLQRAGGRR